MDDVNKKLGNKFEDLVAREFIKFGFWVHKLNQNTAGQPADLIAVRYNQALLIECKWCQNNKFALSRVEDNQWLAMERYVRCDNFDPIFVVGQPFGDGIRLSVIPYTKMVRLRDTNVKQINGRDLRFYEGVEKWLMKSGYIRLGKCGKVNKKYYTKVGEHKSTSGKTSESQTQAENV